MRGQQAVLAIVLAGLLGCGRPSAHSSAQHQEAGEAGPSIGHSPVAPAGEIGSRLPEFSLKTLDGREVSSASLRGKVALIDYWATWCEPCKKEMPGYQQLAERYGARGFAVVGLKFDVMADTVDPLKFAQSLEIHYPLAVPDEALNQKFGGIEGLPTTFIYDRSGVLRKKIIGFEYTNVVEAAIRPLL